MIAKWGAELIRRLGGGGGDALFSYVTALLYNESWANATTGVSESSAFQHVVTTTGNAQNDTTSPPTGLTSSRIFDGTGDRDSLPNGTEFAFGSGDFTIEMYINPRVQPAGLTLVANKWNGAWHIGLDAASANSNRPTTFTVNGLSIPTVFATNLTIGSWQHLCIERFGTTITIYKDGVSIGSGSVGSGSISADTGALEVGGYANLGGYDFDGKIAGFRITKGIARYQGAFTPPTLPYPTN